VNPQQPSPTAERDSRRGLELLTQTFQDQKSGSEIRIRNQDQKSGSEIRIRNQDQKSGSEIADRDHDQQFYQCETSFILH